MLDATPLWASGDWERLRERLQLDGYLLLRGVLPETDVLQVRSGSQCIHESRFILLM